MHNRLNRDNVDRCDSVIFGENYNRAKYTGGIRRFDMIGYEQIRELLDLDAIDPEDRQNNGPTFGETAEFLRTHPNFVAHGYVASPGREDYRVSIEGVMCGPGYTLTDVQDFFTMFHNPDELTVDDIGLYCWFD